MYVICACYNGKVELHSTFAGSKVKDQPHQNSLVLVSLIQETSGEIPTKILKTTLAHRRLTLL